MSQHIAMIGNWASAAVQHAVAVHGHQDSPQLREQLAKMIKTQNDALAPGTCGYSRMPAGGYADSQGL